MMPLGAPSISKYGSLVRLDAQIVALRAHCVRTALKAPPKNTSLQQEGRLFGIVPTCDLVCPPPPPPPEAKPRLLLT